MEAAVEQMVYPKYERYKDSGIEWLEEIPEHWNVWPIGRICKLKSVSGFIEEELLSVYLEQGVIRFSEVEEKRTNVTSLDLSKYQLVEVGDFVLNNQQAWRGSVGVSKYRGIVSPAYLVLELSKKLVPEFANYLFRDKLMVSNYLVSSKGVGTIQRNLYWPTLKDVKIWTPSIEEQSAIAAFLDRKSAQIDQAIARKERQIELLKEHRQILIHRAVTRGLDPNIPMKDSGVEWIGEIPAHWEVKRLKKLCQAFGRIGFRGYTTSDLVGEGEGSITLSPSNIKDDFMIFDKCSYLSWAKYTESPEIQIFENDILIVKTGSTYGKVGIVKGLPLEATINPQLLVLKNVKINPDYFYSLLKTSVVQAQIETEVIGSTIPTISENKIMNFKVAIPPDIEITQIMVYVDSINSIASRAILSKEKEIEKLKELKASLINAAVTGKIKVTLEEAA